MGNCDLLTILHHLKEILEATQRPKPSYSLGQSDFVADVNMQNKDPWNHVAQSETEKDTV